MDNGSVTFDLFVEEDLDGLDELAVEGLPQGLSPVAGTLSSAGSFGSFSTFGGCVATFSSGSTASTVG
jgi:hypothetical protein